MRKYPYGRLMFRHEGSFWNVYFGTGPKDALHLGSIHMGLVIDNPRLKDAFMEVFSQAIAAGLKEMTGQTPTMTTSVAPESERSGNA